MPSASASLPGSTGQASQASPIRPNPHRPAHCWPRSAVVDITADSIAIHVVARVERTDIAGVAAAIPVPIQLGGIGYRRAVVAAVDDTIEVGVGTDRQRLDVLVISLVVVDPGERRMRPQLDEAGLPGGEPTQGALVAVREVGHLDRARVVRKKVADAPAFLGLGSVLVIQEVGPGEPGQAGGQRRLVLEAAGWAIHVPISIIRSPARSGAPEGAESSSPSCAIAAPVQAARRIASAHRKTDLRGLAPCGRRPDRKKASITRGFTSILRTYYALATGNLAIGPCR